MFEKNKEILTLLPHQPPFRFIDHVTRYVPDCLLEAMFSPFSIKEKFGIRSCLPETILIEGLAQAAVLFMQLETRPLKEDETPLLGSLNVAIHGSFRWEDQFLYRVESIRILEKQAVLKGKVFVAEKVVVSGLLSVAVS